MDNLFGLGNRFGKNWEALRGIGSDGDVRLETERRQHGRVCVLSVTRARSAEIPVDAQPRSEGGGIESLLFFA